MSNIDNYCSENKLESHFYNRKVLWDNLKLYSDLKEKHTDEFIETHLHQWKNGLWT
tara:strand:+ start:140 stop:307 length:168 start_codon:yes stop_codon:yes gene_type:complete